MSLEQLIDALRTRGLVPTEAAAPVLGESQRPWFVSLLLGAAGWLAGLLLLVFVGMVFKPDSSPVLIVLGLVLMGAAWAMYSSDSDNAFMGQLALALSMAGQIALAIGLLKDVRSEVLIAGVLLALQIAVLAIMPDRAARTIAALFACVAWGYAVRFVSVPSADWDDWFFPVRERLDAFQIAIAWLATWAPLIAICHWLVVREARWMASPLRDRLRPALSGVLIALAVAGFATEPVVTLAFGFEGIGLALGWWSLFTLLSIGLSVFAAWCAFRLRSHGLLGLAILGALLHLGRFYYHFGTSLLWKSALMLGIGALLVAGAWLLRQRMARESAS